MSYRPYPSHQRPLLDAIADGLLALLSPDDSPRHQPARSRQPSVPPPAAPTGYRCYELPTYRRRGVRIPELDRES